MNIQQANEYFAALEDQPADVSSARAALQALNGTPETVHYIAVAGSAGKTAVASMTAAILQAAGFPVGLYTAGPHPLRHRLWVDGRPADGRSYASLAGRMAKQQPLDRVSAELVCAAALFEKVGCTFAVVELPDPALADLLPQLAACAVTAIGPDGTGRSLERMAYTAASIFREGIPAVTAPGQPKEALQEIIVAAGKTDCTLIVPDQADFTPQKRHGLQNRIDYGGYNAVLPTVGSHAAQNAAVAVELALALWRAGVPIEDEAILAGLAAADVHSGVRVLHRRPLTMLDPCHKPVQASALAVALRELELSSLSLIVGLSCDDDSKAFFSALETGALAPEQQTEKNRMAGMSENAFDRVYLVTGRHPDAQTAQQMEEIAKFHFDAVICTGLADAVEQARADRNEGVVICGCPEFVAEAESFLK